MKKPMTRRGFLHAALGTGAGIAGWSLARPALALPPISRPGKPRFLLSLAAYSFRQFFKDSNRGQRQRRPEGREIDLFDFIDFCADHGCEGTELTSYYFPAEFENDFLVRLKRHAFLRGIAISGTAVGNTFTLPPGEKRDNEIAQVKAWIDRAQVLGAPHIRIFAGDASKAEHEAAVQRCLSALEECGKHAAEKGIMLGLENHGGIVSTSDQLLEIIRAVQNPWIGVNLDTGNFHDEDPYEAMAKCAPYAVNVQVKVEVQQRGRPKEETDLAKVIQILRDANYQGYVTLEYEAAADPWKAVPDWLQKIRALI